MWREGLGVGLLGGALMGCGAVVVAAVGVQDDLANSAERARIRGTLGEAKLALSSLASAEQIYLRANHAWALFPLTPDRVPPEPVVVAARPEWAALDWAPPRPTRFCFQAEAVAGAPAPEVLLH